MDTYSCKFENPKNMYKLISLHNYLLREIACFIRIFKSSVMQRKGRMFLESYSTNLITKAL